MRTIVAAVILSLLFSSCVKTYDSSPTGSATTALNAGEPFEGTFMLDQGSTMTVRTRQWQGIPSVTIDRNGKIFAVWYTGSGGEGPGNYITLAVSSDKGKTWKQNALVVYPSNKTIRFFDPVFFKDKYDNIHLNIAKCRDNKLWDGRGGVWSFKIDYVNNKFTWTTPKRLADGIMMCAPAETNDRQEVIYPIAVWQRGNPVNTGIHVYTAQNYDALRGQLNFAKKSTIPFPPELRIFDEHQIVQLKDSSYLAMIRGTNGIYYTKSRDLVNWDTARKFNIVGATASSRFFIGRLKSGRLAFILNNNSNRTDLKIFLSENEGLTWPKSLLIDNRQGISYPDLAQAEDGTISVVYDYDRFEQMNILHTSFTESDILNNKPGNIRRSVVSKR